MEVRGIRARPGGAGGHGQHRVHHQVHRNDVHDALGEPRELGDRAPPVGQDDRLRHLEALDPPRIRVRESAFDDRRTHDRQRHTMGCRELLGGPLGQRLGERVDVRPAERLGAGPAVLDQSPIDPGRAPLLRVRRHDAGARPGVLGAGLLQEAVQQLGPAGRVLGQPAGGHGRLGLGLPVDPMGQRPFVNDPLGDPGDVRRRDVDQVRAASTGQYGFVQPAGPQHVDLERMVDRRVEGDGRRAVEDQVEVPGQLREVAGHVALEDRDPFRQDGVEAFLADPAPELAEGIARHDLPDPGLGGAPVPAPDQHDHPRVREVRAQPLQQGGAQEAGDAGDQDVAARQAGADVDRARGRGGLAVYHSVDSTRRGRPGQIGASPLGERLR